MASSSSSRQQIVEYEQQKQRSIADPKLYDAFISHRGPDVKHTLAKQLYDLLKARKCRAFLYREEIEGGDSIPAAIHNAICSSVVQIAIFSRRYAESSWCLDELVLMLEQTDALFIPVFYDVQPWELGDIENEQSQYSAAFSDYQRKGRNLHKLEQWKTSLESASKKPSYEKSEHEEMPLIYKRFSDLVFSNLGEEIVSRVLQEMKKRTPLHVGKYPVGLPELVQDFERSCSMTARGKVTIVGIFGLGGAGKTTLAKELLNIKCSGYNASCFLSDVRESHARRDLHTLQSKLFKNLFHEDRKFGHAAEGIGQLEHHLGRAKHWHFLIVLDDINHREQLDFLLPEAMLGPGSLVIMTTRDQSVLAGADIHYRVKEMNWDNAKTLFCNHAFCGRDPPTAFEKLVESFVGFCGGLPLSLKVLGAHLYGRNEDYWELEFQKVKNIQPRDIMKSLKISFYGLDSQEKQIFIDIACYFNKQSIYLVKNVAMSIWEASGWSAELAVQTLQDKCLVEFDINDEFQMHDQLRDLGRQLADDLIPPRMWKPVLLRSMVCFF
ncbi:disease resistance protein Roq1-like [Cryptomeria japonica]|uniref:disease resistance protein Roq1-like n=1 Tax=Cryptomeria japonica TaxID=3369 RepID=UPI0027DA2D28|nr:disease resistance protein Roq1-like [Cryptomeria japonica]